jgi:hypothetical protein
MYITLVHNNLLAVKTSKIYGMALLRGDSADEWG